MIFAIMGKKLNFCHFFFLIFFQIKRKILRYIVYPIPDKFDFSSPPSLSVFLSSLLMIMWVGEKVGEATIHKHLLIWWDSSESIYDICHECMFIISMINALGLKEPPENAMYAVCIFNIALNKTKTHLW